MKKASWKTNSAGIGMILTGLGAICAAVANENYELIMPALGTIVGGVGLMNARDNDKSSEDVGVK